MQFGKKNNYKHHLYSRPVIVLLFILVILLGKSVYGRYTVERDMAERRERSELELELKLKRRDQLGERVEYLEGDRGQEEEIRKNFDVAKEGEQVIILMGDSEELENEELEGSLTHSRWYQFWR